MRLDKLSLEELEELRKKVRDEICGRKAGASGLDPDDLDFCPSDDRSCGHLRFTAQTPHGVLGFEAWIAHGGFLDEKTTLDGEVADEALDLDGGSFCDGTTSDEALELCSDAVAAWVGSRK